MTSAEDPDSALIFIDWIRIQEGKIDLKDITK
jgi:hypothetical protein